MSKSLFTYTGSGTKRRPFIPPSGALWELDHKKGVCPLTLIYSKGA